MYNFTNYISNVKTYTLLSYIYTKEISFLFREIYVANTHTSNLYTYCALPEYGQAPKHSAKNTKLH